MASDISKEDLEEAYTLGRNNKDELTQELLLCKSWGKAKILAVFNRLVEARVCALYKSQNGQPSIWCKIRPEKSIRILKELDANDYRVYCNIELAGNKGIWTADIRKQTGLLSHQIQKSVKHLCEVHQLIKPVKNIHVKNRKVYMLSELEPSKEIVGGSFYLNSEFNDELVENLRERIKTYLMNGQAATLETIANFVRSSGGLQADVSNDDIRAVIRTLEYDQNVLESVLYGTDEPCFMWSRWYKMYSLLSVPCGSCPVFTECSIGKGHRISPSTCEYFMDWLGYDFDSNGEPR